MESIRAEINSILVDEFEIAPELLLEEALIRDTLELDSLDAVDLSVTLTDRIEVEVDPSAFYELRTLGDIYEMVEGLLTTSKG